MEIILKGITNHGKNRIREHGNRWRIIEPMVKPAPSMPFIQSVKTGDKRWLNHNFEIVGD